MFVFTDTNCAVPPNQDMNNKIIRFTIWKTPINRVFLANNQKKYKSLNLKNLFYPTIFLESLEVSLEVPVLK